MIDLPIRSCVRPGFVWARRGRGFLLHRDCRFVEIRFYLHRVRRCVEIGFYLHRDCRYIGRWGTRAETTLLLFHPRCKQNFVVVFVSFFLELESIGTRKFKIVKIRGIYPRCKQNLVVVFVSFFLELESIGTRAFKIVKIWSIYPRCSEIASSFWCRFFLS